MTKKRTPRYDYDVTVVIVPSSRVRTETVSISNCADAHDAIEEAVKTVMGRYGNDTVVVATEGRRTRVCS